MEQKLVVGVESAYFDYSRDLTAQQIEDGKSQSSKNCGTNYCVQTINWGASIAAIIYSGVVFGAPSWNREFYCNFPNWWVIIPLAASIGFNALSIIYARKAKENYKIVNQYGSEGDSMPLADGRSCQTKCTITSAVFTSLMNISAVSMIAFYHFSTCT